MAAKWPRVVLQHNSPAVCHGLAAALRLRRRSQFVRAAANPCHPTPRQNHAGPLRLRVLVVSAVLAALMHASGGYAQAPRPASTPPPAIPGAAAEREILPGLPRPPDAPRSLFEQPSPTPPYACDPLPGPYFELDPRLDPPWLPQPGWFADVEVEIAAAHVKNRLTDIVQVGTRTPDTVHVPPATLDWTGAPRFEVGYRLPSGFGEFAVAYRFLTSEGTGTVFGPDALAAVKSRLDINIVDLDYTSREFFTFQWPYCAMRWRFGVRWADAFFDARAVQPFAAAAAGTGIFETYASNNFWGVGPHAGLELARRWDSSGLALVGRVDGATLLGRLRQNFSETSTTVGANGPFLAGSTRQSVSQDVPIITAFLGLRWQPPRYPSVGISAGYEYEYWWNVGRNSSTSSRGELSDQGILLRAEFNF
jgi:hypothetical protein